jgi:hypothetical protein
MKLIEVKWADAWVNTIDMSVDDAKELEPIIRTSAGWRVAENTKGIILATDYFNNDSEYINTPMFIPWGVVLEYWEYETDEIDNS